MPCHAAVIAPLHRLIGAGRALGVFETRRPSFAHARQQFARDSLVLKSLPHASRDTQQHFRGRRNGSHLRAKSKQFNGRRIGLGSVFAREELERQSVYEHEC
jgi:hypothetical protein